MWRTAWLPTFSPTLRAVGVEDRHDAEAVVGEDVRARRSRWPRWPAPNSAMLCWPRGPQDLADLRDERVDVVADAALAELAEARQVAADLRRVDVGVVGELLGGDRLLAHLLGLREDLQVARQARGDAERQALGQRRRRRPPSRGGMLRRRRAHRRSTLAARGEPRRSASSTKKSYSSSPVERDDRDALEVAARAARRRPRCRPRELERPSGAIRRATARASSHRWQPGAAVEGRRRSRGALPQVRGYGVERRGASGVAQRRRPSARREAIIAALSVHSSRGGTWTVGAERGQRARAAGRLAATPPPIARRRSPVCLQRRARRAARARSTIARW